MNTLFTPILKNKAAIDSNPIVNGQLLASKDTGDLFLDVGSSRIDITDIKKVATYAELPDVPLSKFYYVEDDYTIYYPTYRDGDLVWTPLNNDYSKALNKPQINGTVLSGNKTGADLGLISTIDVPAITSNYIDVTEVTSGYLCISDTTVPVSVEINNVRYDINDEVIHEDHTYKIPVDPILAEADLASYSGVWRVWRAGGKEGSQGAAGSDGKAAIITSADVVSVTTLPAGGSASVIVENAGTSSNRIFHFSMAIPRGLNGSNGSNGSDGKDGSNGSAASITSANATVTTLEPSESATVNVITGGTSLAREFTFELGIPRGLNGSNGSAGKDGKDGEDGQPAGFGSGTGTATMLPTGSNPTVSVTLTGENTAKNINIDLGIPYTEKLESNYIDVQELTSGYIVVDDDTIPVSVEINNVRYDINNTIIHENNSFKIDTRYILAAANLSSYSGIWRVWRAGGSCSSSAYIYGVDVDLSISNPTSSHQRVTLNVSCDTPGNPMRYNRVASFYSLPAHKLRRCVMDDLANRHVNYYLDPLDSTKKEDGSAADLTGTDGDVMVEFPVAYYRIDSYTDSDAHEHIVKLISDKPFLNSKPFPAFYVSNGGSTLQKQYMGAFKGYLDTDTGKLRSIVGVKPTVSKSISQFRAASVSNGGTNVNFLLRCWIGWLVEIEFSSTDTQTYISRGLSEITSYDAAYLRHCGRTVSFGNGTGEIMADTTGVDADLEGHWHPDAYKIVTCSYRGIEDPWGACYDFDDGIQKYQDATAGDYAKSGYWFTTDTSKYTQLDTDKGYGPENTPFPSSGNTGANTAWVSQPWPKTEGYTRLYDPLTYFSTDVTGSSTTYLCNYLYNNDTAGARVVLRGGCLINHTICGAFFVNVVNVLTYSFHYAGSRLAC